MFFIIFVAVIIVIISLCSGKKTEDKSSSSSVRSRRMSDSEWNTVYQDRIDDDYYEDVSSGKGFDIYERFASGTQTQNDELLLSEEDPETFHELYD